MNTKSIPEVSEESRSLYTDYRKLHERILKLQQQISDVEASYLDETPYGNIVRGWEGYIDTKQSRKELNTMKYKSKPYAELDYLFSNSSAYVSFGMEPEWSLVDPWNLDTTMASKSARQTSSNTKSRTSSEKNENVGSSGNETSTSSILRRKSSLSSISGATQTQEIVNVASTECKVSAASVTKEAKAAGMISSNGTSHNNALSEGGKSKKRKREKQTESHKDHLTETLSVVPVSASLNSDVNIEKSNTLLKAIEQPSLEESLVSKDIPR
ncbi:unnamed protein product [Albugo candida]|uniref:Chromatin modification-related protein MEAF6 n=1 Tax=Albugo candida TaxID=65357 RepID=A0A024GUL9_9STRA|nr:unnamed protein product [Albugo candida]|eukprot:CCI50057.1 unnamed protein product [Albugo candida]